MPVMSFPERVYRAVTNRMPARMSSEIDWLRPSYRVRWGGPMNGQARRRDLVRRIFGRIAFDEVVETGTFRGSTTEFLAHLSGLPVHSMESVERFYIYAARRCAELDNVHIAHEDSRATLRRLAARPEARRIFFYLDAHWDEDVPRHEELRIIHARWADVVVMIDDFEVPDDPGYGVAMYGGHRLTAEYLPDLPGWRSFYPAARSADDTGARRGCIVLASAGMARELDALDLLRPGPVVDRGGQAS